MKGIVGISLSKDDDAIDAYLECISEESEFDPRVLQDCLLKLKSICARKGSKNAVYQRFPAVIDEILQEYTHKQKEIIILVNSYI
jgi:hypothetical protein